MLTNKSEPNKLVKEKSPYLLQHAYNPVNWYPWGEEAFDKAKQEKKPIFLSIGYSTCHWCHVMERESFEDQEVAELLNQGFISIKVDREERPDIDHIYMNVCQALTGSGGWPLTIFMDADRKPFFAGTYFPKKDRMGMPGLIALLENIQKVWEENPVYLKESTNRIMNLLNRSEEKAVGEVSADLLKEAFQQLSSEFDPKYGGFGRAPKFPTPHNLYFLLRYWYMTKEAAALSIVEKTLDSMYYGGIYDHIGYGFSRYSTDAKWLVPHFEKMLYDNALLAIAYLETYQITKNKNYARVAEQIFTYVLRDMTSPEGGFYSAEDADSEGVEGKFYIWSKEEILQILGEQEGEVYCTYYDITDKGNFEGKNIPNRIQSKDQEVDNEQLERCRKKLFVVREERIHPHKDDKILTGWNGLMIAALSMGGRVLGNPEYIHTAKNAVGLLEQKLVREDGRLLARYRDGQAAFPAYVDDYAFYIWGLIELYETTFEAQYLQNAVKWMEELIKYFWDDINGGLFVYGSDAEQLIARPKEIYDGAMPSGNSVSAWNLLRLSRLTGNQEWEEYANKIQEAFQGSIAGYPKGYSFALMALQFMKAGSKEVVVVTEEKAEEADWMKEILWEKFRPFTVSLLYAKKDSIIKEVATFLLEYNTVDGKPTAYICQNFSCQTPVTEEELFRQTLD